MSFGGFILTNQGRRELAKAEIGSPLEFDYVAVGDGERKGSVLSAESLSHELHQLTVLSVARNGDSVIVETELASENIQNGFYFREIGLYANGILYAYDNAGQDAEYIDAAGAVVARQKRIRIALTVSSEAAVTVKMDPGLHALQKDFLEHVMDQGNPHNF